MTKHSLVLPHVELLHLAKFNECLGSMTDSSMIRFMSMISNGYIKMVKQRFYLIQGGEGNDCRIKPHYDHKC